MIHLILQLDVTVETPIKSAFRVKLNINKSDIQLARNTQTSRWIPNMSPEVSESSKVHVMLKIGRTLAGVSFGKEESVVDIDVQEAVQQLLASMQPEILVSTRTTFLQQPAVVTVSFRSPPTSESVRFTLQKLQDATSDFRHIIEDSTQKNLDVVIKYGVAFSELDPRSKAAFSVLTVTFELIKQQKQRDQSVSGLSRQLNRILPFADEALKEAVDDNKDILRKTITRLYSLTMDVAEFSCDYVKRSRFKRLAKSMASNRDQERISESTNGLSEMAEDFSRAVNVEMLKAVRSMEEKMLLDRLEPTRTVYRLDRGCMEGTRVSLLDEIVAWAMCSRRGTTTSVGPDNQSVYWLYGIPGIGKTAMAHSICAQLHKEGRLGGTFFCRRDDPELSDPKSVLPTLIYNLAETWGGYRKLIAEKLRNDPKLTRHSADDQLFLRLLESLQSHPPHSLVLVIDALDECGDSLSRSSLIARLIDASSRVSWLRIIVTSRQDSDIESSFMRFDGRYSSKDLATDDRVLQDIRLFTQSKLYSIASRCRLPDDWPGDEKLDEIVERSGGLFIFVETLSQLLKGGLDPDQYLVEALSVGSGSALERLYNLYTTAIRSQIDRNQDEFRSAMGTIIVVGRYRPLSDEAVAELAGLRTNVVTTLVNKLGSLLYRDAGANRGIRVRHLSVIDFLTGSSTPEDLRVNTKRANRDVGLGCLKVMTQGLRFNICGIESSFLSNSDVVDLQPRIDQSMSATLQYSCLHWSYHLYDIADTLDEELIGRLNEFTKAPRLLYWMEALSVMGKVPIGDSLLRQARAWLKPEMSVGRHIEDALQFILAFREPMMRSAPHIYISGLAFIPTETELWRYVEVLFRNSLVVEEGGKKLWPDQSSVLTGHGSSVASVAYSPDGRRIISGSWDNTIRIWDTEMGTGVGKPLEGHTRPVTSVAYSPDGCRIISGSFDSTIRI
ncbi:POC1 centriolar protein A [Serendipita sp. 397]|nr:POC1 centriolar protein A [Serendipita sp. 397]